MHTQMSLSLRPDEDEEKTPSKRPRFQLAASKSAVRVESGELSHAQRKRLLQLQANVSEEKEAYLPADVPSAYLQRIKEQYHRERPHSNLRDGRIAVESTVDAEAREGRLHAREEQKEAEAEADALYEGMLKLSLEHTKEVLERRQVSTRENLSKDLLRDIRRCTGDIRLEKIRQTLNSMGYTRSQFQRCFHDAFIRACLPLIYKDEWSLNSERVFKELGIDRISAEVMILAPRRFGKSVSIAMFVLA